MIAHTSGQGTPLVMVHGFAVDHRILLPLEDMVGDRPFRRVYVDLPWAEGAEDTGAATPGEVADAVLEEVREVAAGEPFAVLGSSFGAMVARHVAHELRAQCAGLATLAGVFEMDHAKRRLPGHQVVRPDDAVVAEAGDLREEFTEMAVLQTPAAFRAFRRHVAPGMRGADQAVLTRLGERYAEAPVPEAAAAPFEAPSLHVLGRQDHVVGHEDGWALREHYVRGTFVTLDAVGHNLHLERPAVVGALVADWLDRVEEARSVRDASSARRTRGS